MPIRRQTSFLLRRQTLFLPQNMFLPCPSQFFAPADCGVSGHTVALLRRSIVEERKKKGGQQPVRNVWSDIGRWHLNPWLLTLVE